MAREDTWTIPVEHRRFVGVEGLPYWANKLIRDPAQRPRGISRFGNKFAKFMYRLLYHRMGLHGAGRIILDEGRAEVPINGGNSVYVDFASRAKFGGYEAVETALLDRLLARANVFFDIGSNWGYYTLLARTHKLFRGEIFAFDLLASMSDELEKIISAANFDRVHVQRFGLSDTNGEVFISREHHAHLTRVLVGEKANSIQATVRRLDDLDLPRPDLIKMDVEDHELSVFRGGKDLFRTQQPAILFESRPANDGLREELLAFLLENGYALFVPNFANRTDKEILLRKINPGRGGWSASEAVNFLALPENGVERWLSSAGRTI